MSQIKINVQSVIGLNPRINNSKVKVTNVKTSFNTIKGRIDGKILNRSNIRNRLTNLSSQLSTIESNINKIKSTVEKSANSYYQVDIQVRNSQTQVKNRIKSLQSVKNGIIKGTSENSKQFIDKETIDKKEDNESLFMQIVKDDWKVEGDVINVSGGINGDVMGFDASGNATGSVLGGTIKTKSKANWNIDDKEGEIEKSISANGYIAQGNLDGNIGLLGVEGKGSVGNVGATGQVGVTIFEDGKVNPSLELKAKAEASVVEGEAELKFGSSENNVHGEAEGSLLKAEAEASIGVGDIEYKDSNDKTKNGFGVQGKVGAEAYLAEGEISGGFTILGIKIDAGISGKAGGVGATAEGRVTTGGLSGEIGAGLGLGAGLEISIDWSNFSLF